MTFLTPYCTDYAFPKVTPRDSKFLANPSARISHPLESVSGVVTVFPVKRATSQLLGSLTCLRVAKPYLINPPRLRRTSTSRPFHAGCPSSVPWRPGLHAASKRTSRDCTRRPGHALARRAAISRPGFTGPREPERVLPSHFRAHSLRPPFDLPTSHHAPRRLTR